MKILVREVAKLLAASPPSIKKVKDLLIKLFLIKEDFPKMKNGEMVIHRLFYTSDNLKHLRFKNQVTKKLKKLGLVEIEKSDKLNYRFPYTVNVLEGKNFIVVVSGDSIRWKGKKKVTTTIISKKK